MKKSKNIYGLLILLGVGICEVQANWVKDNIIDVSTDMGYYKTQTRNIYTLGSQTIKFREVGSEITPFHMEPPRFNVGCGGIDIAMGGFAYLDPDFIIEKLKAISAAAPAFVYQMAISALCKDCQNIMNELEKFSNMINGMNFDTCDAIQAAQKAGGKLGETMNKNLSSGQSDSWMSEKLGGARKSINDYKDGLTDFFGGDSKKAKDKLEVLILKGSLLHLSATKGLSNVSKLDLLGNDESGDKLILSIYRAAVGDIIGSEDAKGQPTDLQLAGGTVENLFKTIYEGGKVPTTSYNAGSKKIANIGEHNIEKGARDIIRDELVEIYNKMKNKEVLTLEQKKFLSALSFPVYRFLNVSLLAGTSDFNLIASQIAIEQTKSLVLYLSQVVARGISSYVAENGKEMSETNREEARKMIANINKINEQTLKYYDTLKRDFTDSKNLNDYMQKKEQHLKSQNAYQAFMSSALGK